MLDTGIIFLSKLFFYLIRVEDMKYKLVCIDIDGTLLDSNKKLSLKNKLAINYEYKNNVKIAIASGRSPMGIKDLIDELGIKIYEICLNGACIK